MQKVEQVNVSLLSPLDIQIKNGRWKTVETSKEFIVQEVEFQIVALETIRGVKTANKSFEQK